MVDAEHRVELATADALLQASKGGRLQVEIHNGRVEDIFTEWAELYALDDRATPFQSPEWARAWWRHWGLASRPWTVIVRDAERVVGLAPRQLVLAARVLRAGAEPGDYWDILARPEMRAQVEDAIFEALTRHSRSWDVAVLSRLLPSSSSPEGIKRAGLRPAYVSAMPCPGIPLPASLDEYFAMLPTQRRTNLRRHLRRLDEGLLEMRRPPVAELPEALARWDALRKHQWAHRGKRLGRSHRDRRMAEFLAAVTTELVPQGRADVLEVLHDGKLVGSFVNFCDSRVFYNYLGGYEPTLAQLGIGKVVLADAIRASIAAGRSLVDLGRGAESYKYWYGARDRNSPMIVIGNGPLRTRMTKRVMPLAERIPL
jgi:CelD/BcsL family acetyltransferase involved in cellulose biosynthesis